MATLNISLTDEMRSYVEEGVASDRYGNASEYIRELVRNDEDRQRGSDLERLLLEGIAAEARNRSGEPPLIELAAQKQAKGK